MTEENNFIFIPGLWVGEGEVSFNTSTDVIPFSTKWEVKPKSKNGIECIQEVKMKDSDPVKNKYLIYEITPKTFALSLENDVVVKAYGKGVFDPQKIAWEFREKPEFQGYEVYNKKNDNEYSFHAEFTSTDQFLTLINGIIVRV